MTTIINGSSPSITFSDSTTQASAGLTAASPTITSGVLTYPDATTQSSGSGVAKAWGSYAYSAGAAPTLRYAYNISSVTRSSTGTYVFAFTNSLADANYAVIGNCVFSSTYNGAEFIPSSSAGTWTSTTFYVVTTTAQGVGSDPAGLSVMVLR